MSQRKTNRIIVISAALILLAAMAAPARAEAPTDAQILHLLNRISFGPAPGDVEEVRRIGLQDYIERQLHPSVLPSSPELNARLAELPTLTASMPDLMNAYELPEDEKKMMSEEQRKEFNKHQHVIARELSEAKILRGVLSPAQLQEVMTDFWYNHFNVFDDKGLDKIFVGSYERDAIRPYALGKFRDLLFATAHHPAMLFYLDNWLNTDPNSPRARGKKIGINENYARELMELHTLGVNGGYTQADVTALAHILTGWGLGEGQPQTRRAYFFFDPQRHDYGNVFFLGTTIRGGNDNEIMYVLDMLAANKATAHHIAYQLAQYFVADEPPESLVDKLAATFSSTGGDIAAVLKVLFYAPEFWDPKYQQAKFKPPFRYVVSALRAANAVPPGDTKLIQAALNQMGEPLHHCLTPNGYADTNDQWLNSDALLKRINFAKSLSGFLGADAAKTIQDSLGQGWSKNTLDTALGAQPKLQPALLLSSPEFVYY